MHIEVKLADSQLPQLEPMINVQLDAKWYLLSFSEALEWIEVHRSRVEKWIEAACASAARRRSDRSH